MKKVVFILLCLFVLASCTIPVIAIPEENEILIDGSWGGWEITTETMSFKTTVGIKTINFPIQIVKHNNKWYIWENGYRGEIFPIQ